MTVVNNGEYQHIVHQLLAYIKSHASEKDVNLLKIFAEKYYSSSSVEDLKERSIEELYHILLSQWKLIYQRAPYEAKICIFNPDSKKDGWHSTHTIVQISHDDIPFLVDSTRMAINRYGYQIHFIIHFGGLKVIRDSHQRITGIVTTGSTEKNASTEAPLKIEMFRFIVEKGMQFLKAVI